MVALSLTPPGEAVMPDKENVSNCFSALAAARGIVSNIEIGIAKYSIDQGDNEQCDATAELRNIQLKIIQILEEITIDKERRKSARPL